MVLFLDSGIGGLAYLEAVRAAEPTVELCYLADAEGFPYGSRDPEWLRERIVALVGAVAARETLTAIVVACNTASVVALAELRRAVTVPVVGVVPAVKPAARTTERRVIGVLATPRTVHDRYTDDLVATFAGDVRVERHAAPDLVVAAERWVCGGDDDDLDAAIRVSIEPLIDAGADTLVLACTHFVMVRERIRAALPPGVAVVDSLDGVTRRLLSLVAPGAATRALAERPLRPILYVTGALPERLACLGARYRVHRLDVPPVEVGASTTPTGSARRE